MKAIIFDMDGVLIDSQRLHQQAEAKVFGHQGLNLTVDDLRYFAGGSREAMQAGITQRFDTPIDWQRFDDELDQELSTLFKEVQPIPGVLELVRELKDYGFHLGLATSSRRELLDQAAEKFDYNSLFDELVCSADIRNSKPDPEIFLITAARLHTHPTECAVIEDSVNGIYAAKAAEMYAVGITTTFPRYELIEADRVIDRFDEINAKYFRTVDLAEARP